MDPSAQQDDIMHNIQDMVGNLLKNAIEKVQTTEMREQLGSTEQEAAPDSDASLIQAQMDITEIKKIVNTMHKFLDNMSTMIAQLESGNLHYSQDNDKFLDDYIDTADNIFEIAAFSMKDSLTGLSNKYGFDNRLVLEWNRAARDKSSLSLLIIGIDGYTSYKETNGNQQGDILLKTVSKSIELSIMRATDFIARLDDSFAIILSITDVDGVKIVADRIFQEIESLNASGADELGNKITVSIGASVQTPTHNEQAADFIMRANNALKKAGESGQSSVIIS